MACFVAGTLVLTTTGLLAIDKIKPGDKVISTDPDTLETSEKTVLETYIRKEDRLVHLVVGGEEIVSTVDHPFYVKGKGFVYASDLYIGAELIDKDGNTVTVSHIYREKLEGGSTNVYNFKVEDYHTYYVSEQCVLVHNAECGGTYEEVRKQNKKNLLMPERFKKHLIWLLKILKVNSLENMIVLSMKHKLI